MAGKASNATQALSEGSIKALLLDLAGNLRVTVRPWDVGALGSYTMTTVSGTIAAAMAAGKDIWSFRTGAANYYIIRKVTVAMWDVTTGFTAGRGKFDLKVARAFTGSYTTNGVAATLTGNNAKKKTGFATTSVAQIYTLDTSNLGITGLTAVIDAQAIGTTTFPVTATANAVQLPSTALLDYVGVGMSWPLVLGPNEGLVLQATVPATGTWAFQVTVEWDEVAVAP